MSYLILFVVLVIAVLARKKVRGTKTQSSMLAQSKTSMLKEKYLRSLKGYDVRNAVQAGKNYFGALRGKNKTLKSNDMQTISNDTSKMQSPP